MVKNYLVALSLLLLCVAQSPVAMAALSEQQLLANLKKTEAQCGGTDQRTAEYLFVVGKYYQSQKQYARSQPMFDRAMRIFECSPGKNGDLLRYYSDELARAYSEQGKKEQAEKLFNRSLALGRKLPGKDATFVVPNTLAGIAQLYESQGRYPEAEKALKERIEMRHRFMNAGQVDIALVDLAMLYTNWGKYDEAKPLFDELFKISPMPAQVKQAYTAYLSKSECKPKTVIQ